jgi:hypothetical protein
MSNPDNKERDRLLGVGVAVGLTMGMIAGLILFDNIGIGIALGPAIGIVAALGIIEYRKAKRAENTR